MTKRIRMVHFIKGNGSPIVSFKKNRNALCSCGSGKKQKRCCGVETKFYHSKPIVVKEKKTDEQPNGTIDLTQLILDNQNDTNQTT